MERAEQLTVPEDNNDLMSFSSPSVKPTMLLPEKDNVGLSPVVARSIFSSDVCYASPKDSPLAASTPFCVTHTPKFVFPGITTEDDPFDVVERKAQQVTDPWEIAEAEAAKFTLAPPPTDVTLGSSENSKTQSLNTGFIEDSAGNSKLRDGDKTISPTTQEIADLDDLSKETPPWNNSDSDSDEDLSDMIKRLSDHFPQVLASAPAEPLSVDNVRSLSLRSPPSVSLSPFNTCSNLALTSPPFSLKVRDFSSSLSSSESETTAADVESAGNVEKKNETIAAALEKKENEVNSQSSKGCIKKVLAPRVVAKPLKVITNSPAFTPRLPPRLTSRLLQPRVYSNKENH